MICGENVLSGGWRVDHVYKTGSAAPSLLADHHDVHTAEEEPVVEAAIPAHRVDIWVPVDHVAIVTDPVQILENSQ